MPEEEKKTVDIDTSGPETEVELAVIIESFMGISVRDRIINNRI